MARASWSIVLVAGLGSGGCAYVAADTEVVKTISHDPQLAFPGVGPAAGEVTNMTRSIDATVGSNDLLDLATRSQVIGIKFIAESGVTALDFVRSAKIVLEAQKSLPEEELANYVASDKSNGLIEMRVNQAFDHTAYVKSKEPLMLRIEMEAAAPAEDWSTSLEVTFDLQAGGQVNF